MQIRTAMTRLPLAIGAALSLAIHAAALRGWRLHAPPEVRLDAGRTVVRLTLVPSTAAHAAPAPAPPAERPVEEPAPTPEPAPPLPEPVVDAAPEPPPEPPAPPPEPAPAEELAAHTPSMEQDGSRIEEKGVLEQAQSLASIHPAYPRLSRRRGEEGTVVVGLRVLPDGRADRIAVVRSSGHGRLDQAACEAVRNASFLPASRLGRAVEAGMELTFTFRLTDE